MQHCHHMPQLAGGMMTEPAVAAAAVRPLGAQAQGAPNGAAGAAQRQPTTDKPQEDAMMNWNIMGYGMGYGGLYGLLLVLLVALAIAALIKYLRK
jgi:hypothetical protein